MNNKCIYLKQKLNKKLECKKLKKEIKIIDCSNCKYREFKTQICSIKLNKTQSNKNTHLKSNNNQMKKSPVIDGQLKRKPGLMKKKSNKLTNLERNRFSIIYNDLSKCCECGSTYNVSKNEVYEGAYRILSIKYGMICPLCQKCHFTFHNNYAFALKYKVLFQKKFTKIYSFELFVSLFKQDYTYKIKSKNNS